MFTEKKINADSKEFRAACLRAWLAGIGGALIRRDRESSLLHQLDPRFRASCCYTYCLLTRGACPRHVLCLVCRPSAAIPDCLLPAGQGKEESVYAGVCRVSGWISSVQRWNLSLPISPLAVAPSSLCLACSPLQPATLLDEAVCHIAPLPSLSALLSLSQSISSPFGSPEEAPLFLTPSHSLSSSSFFLSAQLRSPLKFPPCGPECKNGDLGGKTEKDGGAP